MGIHQYSSLGGCTSFYQLFCSTTRPLGFWSATAWYVLIGEWSMPMIFGDVTGMNINAHWLFWSENQGIEVWSIAVIPPFFFGGECLKEHDRSCKEVLTEFTGLLGWQRHDCWMCYRPWHPWLKKTAAKIWKTVEHCGTIEKPVILRINATKSKSWWWT